MTLDILGLFIFISGFIIGLGAVTVIDLHGFLGRRSSYWTEATIRTHKITKPLIWLGTILACIGGSIFYRNDIFSGIPMWHAILACILVLNGLYLSFVVSPYLLQKEKDGKSSELLPSSFQNKITLSFIVSFTCWWTSVLLLVVYISR